MQGGGEAIRNVNDLIADMIKQSANEPSRGLYFVQQHVHKAVPAIVSLKDQIVETTGNVELSTEDSRDAIAAVKCMKEVGLPVIDRMLKLVSNASQGLQPSQAKSTNSPVHYSDSEAASYMRNMWDTALITATTVTKRSSSAADSKATAEVTASSSSATGVRSALGSMISEGAGSPSALLDAVQVMPGRYVRAVIDTALGRKAGPGPGPGPSSSGIPSSLTVALEEEELLALDNLPDAETYDKFQAESSAKLEEWLDEPPSTDSRSTNSGSSTNVAG